MQSTCIAKWKTSSKSQQTEVACQQKPFFHVSISGLFGRIRSAVTSSNMYNCWAPGGPQGSIWEILLPDEETRHGYCLLFHLTVLGGRSAHRTMYSLYTQKHVWDKATRLALDFLPERRLTTDIKSNEESLAFCNNKSLRKGISPPPINMKSKTAGWGLYGPLPYNHYPSQNR